MRVNAGERTIGRVLIAGLDGATWDVIRPLAEAGRLPTLQRLMAQGATGVLQSTIPPVTPAAWSSVFTGKNPGKHGIFDFQTINRQSYEFGTIHAHRHREKTLWRLLGEQGKRSIIVDVPFTYPPQPLNGLMITGYGTPRREETVFTYPAELRSVLPRELHGEVRVALPRNNFDRSQRFIDEWMEIMDGRRALLQHLATAEAWDFFMVVFSITDNMAHVFWTYVDPAHPNYRRPEAEAFRAAFFRSYEQCDCLLGELMAAAGEACTTLVISDHGFGSVRPRQYLFQRLLQGGFLAVGGDGAKVGRQKRVGRLRDTLLGIAVRGYARFPALRELVKRLQPGRRQLLKDTLQKAGALPDASAVDYRRSQVIVSNFGLQLWINDAERFAHGSVSADEREAVMARLTEYLLSDVDPITGAPVIRAVHRGRDVYRGAFVAQCPDLVVEYANSFGVTGSDGRANGFTEGGHTHDGILLAHGPAIAHTAVTGASLVDLAPTTLHLLGMPVAPDMDGRVLQEMFTPEFRREHPVRVGDAPAVMVGEISAGEYGADEDADIREQLRQLGYL